jgi:hypothetical protein
MALERAIALMGDQLEPDERWCHALAYGDNDFLMANIESLMANITSLMANIECHMATIEPLMANITSPHGENYFGYGENYLGGRVRWRESSSERDVV